MQTPELKWDEGTKTERIVNDFIQLDFSGEMPSSPWVARLREQLLDSPLGRAGARVLAGEDIKTTDYYREFCARWDRSNWEAEAKRLPSLLRDSYRANWDGTNGAKLTTGRCHGREIAVGPIIVTIDKHGLFPGAGILDGYHRLTAAALLRHPVTVYVHARAPEWEALRCDLYDWQHGRRLYHQFPHPDFDSWDDGGQRDRIALTRGLVGRIAGNAKHWVLDLGCCLGAFAGAFADFATVHAVDFEPRWKRAAEAHATAAGFTFTFGDALSFLRRLSGFRWSAVNAQRFLYHLPEVYAPEDVKEFMRLLSANADALIYDREDTAHELVTECTTFETFEKIGYDEQYRRDLILARNPARGDGRNHPTRVADKPAPIAAQPAPVSLSCEANP